MTVKDKLAIILGLKSPRPTVLDLASPDLTPEEVKEKVNGRLEDVRLRLKRLAIEVDVIGRRHPDGG